MHRILKFGWFCFFFWMMLQPLNAFQQTDSLDPVIPEMQIPTVDPEQPSVIDPLPAQPVSETETKTAPTIETDSTTGNEIKIVPPTEFIKSISIGKIISALIFAVFAYLFILFITRMMYFIAERNPRYRISIKGFVPIIRIVFWILAIYTIIAGIFNPPYESLVALSASVGVAVGFASQDVLKNIFAGIVILIDRPFLVGDKIEVGSYYGEVIEIGLRSTRIVTPDDSMVTVPNSEIMNSLVSNSNVGERNCQVVAEIYLPIDINTDKVRQIALEAAQVSSYIYLNKPIVVLFFNEIKHDRSLLKMRLKAYVSDIRHEFQFKSDMTEIVIRELIKEGLIQPSKLA